jgi:hypothetical protein
MRGFVMRMARICQGIPWGREKFPMRFQAWPVPGSQGNGEVRGHFAALRMQVTMQTELRCIG